MKGGCVRSKWSRLLRIDITADPHARFSRFDLQIRLNLWVF